MRICLTSKNSDKAEENCNTEPQTQLYILKQAFGNTKRKLKMKNRKG